MIKSQTVTFPRVLALTIVGLVACVATLVFVAKPVVNSYNEEPYRMTIRSSEGAAFVRFRRPDRGLVSPEFAVGPGVEAPASVDLRSDDVSIRGCVVGFHDISTLPGRFILWVGGVRFDVMESGIQAGDQRHTWQPG